VWPERDTTPPSCRGGGFDPVTELDGQVSAVTDRDGRGDQQREIDGQQSVETGAVIAELE